MLRSFGVIMINCIVLYWAVKRMNNAKEEKQYSMTTRMTATTIIKKLIELQRRN